MPEGPRIELLHFDGCPTYRAAQRILAEVLAEVLAEEGMDAEIEMVAVDSDEEANRLRFPGSPTIRVDGKDLFPVPEQGDWRLGCRIYATTEGLKGHPTTEMLRIAALR